MTLMMLVMSKRQEDGINEEAVYGQLPNQVKGVQSPLLLVQKG